MTIRQITEYHHISKRLDAARSSNDQDAVRRLKQQVEEAWDYLLLVDPMRTENVYNMIEFFLEQIHDDPHQELINQQCKWKILALARSLADSPGNIDYSAMRRV